jgi:hypothetical protein
VIFDHTVRMRVEGAADVRAPVRASRRRASMSTRRSCQARTASANICLTRRTNC